MHFPFGPFGGATGFLTSSTFVEDVDGFPVGAGVFDVAVDYDGDAAGGGLLVWGGFPHILFFKKFIYISLIKIF